jgi:hypothetical protein
VSVIQRNPPADDVDVYTGQVATLYEAAHVRPAGYPDDLPFVGEVPVSVTFRRAGSMHGPSAQWWSVPDPSALFDWLVQASAGEGWVASGPPAVSDTARLMTLTRGDRVRTIFAARGGASSLVTLADRASA